METQISCEMDVCTPTLCPLERDSPMMNNVMGNKYVFGQVFWYQDTSASMWCDIAILIWNNMVSLI